MGCDVTPRVLEVRDDPMIADGIPPARLIPTAEKRAWSALPIKFISCAPRGSVAQTGARYEPGNAGRTAESKPQTWVGCAAITRSSRCYGRIAGETGEVGQPGAISVCEKISTTRRRCAQPWDRPTPQSVPNLLTIAEPDRDFTSTTELRPGSRKGSAAFRRAAEGAQPLRKARQWQSQHDREEAEDEVIAPIDQNDFRIAPSERLRGAASS